MNLPQYITPILKLTENCNYQCHFCRYASQVSEVNIMEVEMAKRYIKKVMEYNIENCHSVTKITFHGGEPLLWGIEGFEQIIKFEEVCKQKYGMNFINTIQTNGYLLNSEWLQLFKKNKFHIGISLDGPLQLNSHFNKNGNEESMQVVMKNINMMQRENVSFGILSVITTQHLGREKEFYDFWIQNEIKNIGLCYCYDKEKDKRVNPVLLGDFLINLFDLYFWGKSTLKIREFDNAMARILQRETNCCTNMYRERCGYYFTIRGNGNVYFCDEYDLENNMIIGNLNTESVKQIVEGECYQNIKEDSIRIIKNKCSSCQVYNICGAGCRRNDMSKGESNYFCEAYKKLYVHIQETLRKI